MTQKNFMSARALTMEEMENVNGGIRVKCQGGQVIVNDSFSIPRGGRI